MTKVFCDRCGEDITSDCDAVNLIWASNYWEGQLEFVQGLHVEDCTYCARCANQIEKIIAEEDEKFHITITRTEGE